MKFSTQLRERRKKLKLTQESLANKLNVTRQTLSRWKNDLSYPNLDTLVQISQILNISLDCLPKENENSMVGQISSNVRKKRKYKTVLLIIGLLLIATFVFITFLGYGWATQNATIDHLNPFIKTQDGYAILPNLANQQQLTQQVDVFVSDDAFGKGSWLKFETGQYTAKNRWTLIQHNESYISKVRLLNKKQIPLGMREQAGSFYTGYQSKTEGPKIGKKISWW